MDDKSNAVIQKLLDDAAVVQRDKELRNAALEDAAIVADIYAESNEAQYKKYPLQEHFADRAALAYKIARSIRERKEK